jgi:hypothetical protein
MAQLPDSSATRLVDGYLDNVKFWAGKLTNAAATTDHFRKGLFDMSTYVLGSFISQVNTNDAASCSHSIPNTQSATADQAGQYGDVVLDTNSAGAVCEVLIFGVLGREKG